MEYPRNLRAAPVDGIPKIPDSDKPGVAFGGGGVRATACALGLLRGLRHKGALDRIGAISGVSGGAWAAGAYVYRPSTVSDLDFLGPHKAPEAIDLNDERPDFKGIYAESVRMVDRLGRSQIASKVMFRYAKTRHAAWARAVSDAFLRPYGLHATRDRPNLMTWSEDTARAICELNPDLDRSHFAIVPDGRPFLMVGATMHAPGRRIPYEITPLGVGVPSRADESFGGYVQPYAASSTTPSRAGDVIEFRLTDHWSVFKLQDALGASSYVPTKWAPFTPRVDYWAPNALVDSLGTRTAPLSDGGRTDNFGLSPWARRPRSDGSVRRVIAVISAMRPLFESGVRADGTVGPSADAGADVSKLRRLFEGPRSDIQPEALFAGEGRFDLLMRQLRQQRRAGLITAWPTRESVLDSDYWGTDAGCLEVLWVYNDLQPTWRQRLPRSLRKRVEQSPLPALATETAIALWKPQMLAHMWSWIVVSGWSAFDAFLAGEPLDAVRGRLAAPGVEDG